MTELISKDKSRAFIIGDKVHGLTIVITNPVLVVHYSVAELADPAFNTLGLPANSSMAAVVQELAIQFRGVTLDETDNPTGMYDAAALAREVHHSNTIARLIGNGTHVHDVDFCLAFELENNGAEMRGRAANPAQSIFQYIKAATAEGASSPPVAYRIDGIPTSNLGPLAPVKSR